MTVGGCVISKISPESIFLFFFPEKGLRLIYLSKHIFMVHRVHRVHRVVHRVHRVHRVVHRVHFL